MIAKQEVIDLISQLSETQLEKVVSYMKIVKEEESVLNKEQQELLDLLNRTVNTSRGDTADTESQLIAMASDPEIQKELKKIEKDFSIAEYDGLDEKISHCYKYIVPTGQKTISEIR